MLLPLSLLSNRKAARRELKGSTLTQQSIGWVKLKHRTSRANRWLLAYSETSSFAISLLLKSSPVLRNNPHIPYTETKVSFRWNPRIILPDLLSLLPLLTPGHLHQRKLPRPSFSWVAFRSCFTLARWNEINENPILRLQSFLFCRVLCCRDGLWREPREA